MIKNSSSQNGNAFAVIIIILVVAIVSVLGFIFWQNNASKNSPISQDSNIKSSEEANQDNRESRASYLVLQDWGVEIKLADSLADTEVLYFERKSEDRTSYSITTSRIQKLGDKCTKQPFGDTVILYRETEKPIATPDGGVVNENPINGYYYIVTSPIASCSGLDDNGQMHEPSQVEVNDRAALKESVMSLKAVE